MDNKLAKRLKPGTEAHDKLVRLIMDCAQRAYTNISNRFDVWDAITDSLTAYVQLDDEEIGVLKKDSRKPVSIVVPIMFATLETILTYMTAAFINDPILRYEGVDDKDHAGAALLEALVDYQVHKSKVPLHMHTMWRDALAYGIGPGVVGWEETTRTATRRNTPIAAKLAQFFPGLSYTQSQQQVVDQASTLFAINPYLFLPDPNLPITEVQRMNYVGWIDRDTVHGVKIAAATDDDMFNIDKLDQIMDGRVQMLTSSLSIPNDYTDISKPLDMVYMFMKLLPADYSLSQSRNIEKWFFAVAGGSVIVKAQKLNFDHDMFPVVVASPDYDGHSITPTSRLEVLYGMQKTIDWFASSHIANVRKAINDMFVVDPYLINMNDVLNPDKGLLIRLRKSAWGRGVSGAIEQLKVNDVTSNHISDIGFWFDIVQRVSAATDMMQGIMRRSSERRSATEAAGVREASMTRLEHIAKVISYQMMQDIGYMFGSQTIQLMSDDLITRIGGRIREQLKAEYGVDPSPKLLNMEYDVKVHDGSIPGGENGQLWVELYRIMTANPQLAGQFDLVRIFKHIARNLGAKEVEDFVLKVKPMTPDQIQQQVQQGNMVPATQMYNEGGQDVQGAESTRGLEALQGHANLV